MNKHMVAALNVLSQVDIKKNYKLIRQAYRVAKKPRIKLTYQTWDRFVKNGDHQIPIRVFSPAVDAMEWVSDFMEAPYPFMVFIHGGGWVTEDIDTYEKTYLTAARQTGHIVVAVDYRLAPENPFPAALEDCAEVVREVMRWREKLGIFRKITVLGDSAGGNLAAALSLYMRDRGEKLADRQILVYPAVNDDHTENSPFLSVAENGTDYILTSKQICDYVDLYCGKPEDRTNPYFAPLLAGDFSNQPDTLVITAQYDPLRDEGEEYGRKLKDAGNRVVVRRVDDTLHGYFALSIKFLAVKESYEIINSFLRGEDETDGRSG